MDTVELMSTETNRTIYANVVQRTDKKLIVSPEGTTLRLTLHRESVKKHYVGTLHGVEFISKG